MKKIAVYLAAIVCYSLIVTGFKSAHITLGALPTMILFFALFYGAGVLSKKVAIADGTYRCDHCKTKGPVYEFMKRVPNQKPRKIYVCRFCLEKYRKGEYR